MSAPEPTTPPASAPAGRKRGPRAKPPAAPRQMSLEQAVAAAKLGERRALRLADYRLLAGIHGEVPFAIISGLPAVEAIGNGSGIAMIRENLMDLIHEEVMAMDEDLRALGVVPPDTSREALHGQAA